MAPHSLTTAKNRNTLRTPEHAVDQVRAKRIKQMILLAPSFAPRRIRHGIKVVGVNLKAEEMAANVAWSMTYIRDSPVHNKKMFVFFIFIFLTRSTRFILMSLPTGYAVSYRHILTRGRFPSTLSERSVSICSCS